MNTQNLWETLTQNNLTNGEKPQTEDAFAPWYIRFIQGAAGWLASILIMAFFAVFFNFVFSQPSATLVLTLGVLCSVAGYMLIKMLKNDFVEQLGMAFSLCGQMLVAIGLLFVLDLDFTVAAFVFASYQLFLAWLVPQYMHRLLSTAFGLFALLLALNSYGIYGIGSALVAIFFSFIWMQENNWGKLSKFFEPVGLGAAFTLVFSNAYLITKTYFLLYLLENSSNHNNTGWFFQNSALISSLLLSLVFLYVVVTLLKEYKVKFDSRTAIVSFIAVAGLLLISLKISGISTGLLIALVGFARQRMVLIVLGIVSIISFFSWYYYHLNITLLYKSIVLVVLGMALLSSWFAIKYLYKDKSNNSKTKFRLILPTRDKWLGMATIAVALVAINYNINKKEHLIEHGEVLLLKLAPVDPSSIMQGDYMRLQFDLDGKISQAIKDNRGRINNKQENYNGHAIITKDADNVVSFVALFEQQDLQHQQRLIPFKYRSGHVRFTTDAFYFQEDKAKHFEQAEYGEFKISEDGVMLLVNMVDEDLQIL